MPAVTLATQDSHPASIHTLLQHLQDRAWLCPEYLCLIYSAYKKSYVVSFLPSAIPPRMWICIDAFR